MKCSFDTNVLVYSIDKIDGRRHAQALDITNRAAHGNCVLSLQSLAELFAVARRKRVPQDALDAIAKLRKVFPVVAADTDAFDEAIDATLRDGLSFWDAMIWAVVRRAGCTVLFTEDMQDGRKLGGVTFINPFDPKNAALIDELLPAA